MKKVLFVCVHNSARSQMAEALLNSLGGGRFEAESAGLDPGTLNPLAVEAMKEAGVDISGKRTQSVLELYNRGKSFDYVITVCGESEGKCPVFPGNAVALRWPFEDPAAFKGSRGERLSRTREVRDAIRRKIEEFLEAQKG